MDQPSDRLLPLAEVASLIGVERGTLWSWRHREEGPPSFKLRGNVVYRRSELLGLGRCPGIGHEKGRVSESKNGPGRCATTDRGLDRTTYATGGTIRMKESQTAALDTSPATEPVVRVGDEIVPLGEALQIRENLMLDAVAWSYAITDARAGLT